MVSSLSLRPATGQDASAIAAIAEDAGLFPADMLDDMMSPFLSGVAPDRWFVATLGPQVIGFGYCAPERLTAGTWNLLAIGILAKHRGAGVGGRMMQWLEQALRSDGQRLLLVETLGTPEFEATRRFYRHQDFVEEARIRDFYEAGGDKIVFWKQL